MNEAFEKILERLESAKDGVCEHSTCEYTDECCFVDGINKAKEIVQKVAEEYNGGWIPCSERLPEEYGQYLCCDEYGEYIIGYPTERTTGDSFYVETDNEIMNECIAWQPLTKPYKERE